MVLGWGTGWKKLCGTLAYKGSTTKSKVPSTFNEATHADALNLGGKQKLVLFLSRNIEIVGDSFWSLKRILRFLKLNWIEWSVKFTRFWTLEDIWTRIQKKLKWIETLKTKFYLETLKQSFWNLRFERPKFFRLLLPQYISIQLIFNLKVWNSA